MPVNCFLSFIVQKEQKTKTKLITETLNGLSNLMLPESQGINPCSLVFLGYHFSYLRNTQSKHVRYRKWRFQKYVISQNNRCSVAYRKKSFIESNFHNEKLSIFF